MKVFVDEIMVRDENVMKNIVHALEICPLDGGSYEIERVDDLGIDPMGRREAHPCGYRLRVYRNETV